VNIRSKDLLPSMEKMGVTLWREPSLDVTYTGFNWEDPVVGAGKTEAQARRNRLLRRAMSLAFDARSQIDILRNGRAIPAMGPIPPGLPAYDEDLENPWRVLDYDKAIEKAKALMAEAGFADGGPTLTAESVSSISGRQFDEFFINCMANIGIRVRMNYNTWPGFLDKVKRRKAQVFSMAWLGDYPDAENFLQLFYGPNASPGPNNANYSNPEFDALFEKARVMQPGPERTALYRKCQEIVIDDCPWIFQVHRVGFILQHRWLGNYKPHDIAAGTQKYYRVDMRERDETVKTWGRIQVWPLLLLCLVASVPLVLIVVKVVRTE
jgi:ABC-type transport system substrate-binding protein